MHTHAADPGILAHCVAIAVAKTEADGQALMRLAEGLRFGDIVAHSPKLGHDHFNHRLVFFLVHFDFEDDAKTHLLETLRHSASVSLCYAPVVVFLRNGTPAQVQACIEMGFDDVINVPADGRGMATRLATQIGREHLYIETRNYLGPDRHRLDQHSVHSKARQAAEPHWRLTILRTVEAGVQITRREGFLKPH